MDLLNSEFTHKVISEYYAIAIIWYFHRLMYLSSQIKTNIPIFSNLTNIMCHFDTAQSVVF
jgi:hypothetical protein